MEVQPNYFAIIPAAVRYDETLNPMARLLYGEITALCDKKGYCWAKNEYFAHLYQRNKNTISRWVSQLEKSHHIHVNIDKDKGNIRTITLSSKMTIPIVKHENTLSSKKEIPIIKNSFSYKDNNTINNTMNERALALDFIKENFPSRYEQEFGMKYLSQIKEKEKFFLDFESIVEEEQLDFGSNLLARLSRYARNWIKNQDKYPSTQKKDSRTSEKLKKYEKRAS